MGSDREHYLKAYSHLLHRSADSVVDWVNAEIGIFYFSQPSTAESTDCCG